MAFRLNENSTGQLKFAKLIQGGVEMAALIKVLTSEQYQVISEVLDEEGVILISPDTAERIAKELGLPVENLNEQYIDDYDFGGEPER